MRYFLLFLALLALTQPAAAQSNLTSLPPAALPLAGVDQTYVVQGGVSKSAPVSGMVSGITASTPIAPTSGTTTRTLAQHFADQPSVTDFGAKCDGVTNDSPSFQAAINAATTGGVVMVPSTGHACLLQTGIVLTSSSHSGVTLRGVAGMYWPGPYDNVEGDWTKYGSWIHCADTVNTCISMNGDGSGVEQISFWYTQPTPPAATGCGVFCNMTHNWSPTIYPYTISILSPQNFNHLRDINIINASHCIDIEGGPSGVATIFTYFQHMHLGCFNVGTKFSRVDNAMDIHDASYTLWWYPFSSDVIGYTEGDSTHTGNKVDWDMYYLANLHAEGVEFYQSYAAIRATDNTVSSGLGNVTFGAQNLQLANISFNQVCQAITLAATTTHFTGRMSNAILNIDPQTSNTTQCAGYVPNALNLQSDNVEFAITNLDGGLIQTVAAVGGGSGGILHIYGGRSQSYSAFAAGASAFQLNAGAALDMPGDSNELFTTNAAAGPRLSGSSNWPFTALATVDVDGAPGSNRQMRYMSSATSGAGGGFSTARFGTKIDSVAETGGNAGSNWHLDRYTDTGGFVDSPILVNRASGLVTVSDGVYFSGGQVSLPVFTVAALPTCNAGIINTYASVSDQASAPTYGGALTGGGAIHIPVFCNGTSWTAH